MQLWEHQKKAIKVCKKYIENYSEELKCSALIQFPTGTGKTGVISVLSRELKTVGTSIVLCPRTSLRDQLYREVNGAFFDKINYQSKFKKVIVNVKKSKDIDLILKDSTVDYIFVMTVQMYTAISKNETDACKILKSKLDLIIFDEGHYEPSKQWSIVSREIKIPRVIVTATPYRNDLRIFDVNEEFVYFFSHEEAVEKRYIRNLEFINLKSTSKRSYSNFVEIVLNKYRNLIVEKKIPEESRLIIRVDNFNSLKKVSDVLDQNDENYISIHEEFKDSENSRCKREIPELSTSKEEIWVHQYKLLEGIDDVRFTVLAFYEPLLNTRMFVQQVGRILRNPKRELNQTGYIIQPWRDEHTSIWDNYIEFDSLVRNSQGGVFSLNTPNGLLNKIVEAQSQVVYYDGRFRGKFDLDLLDPYKDLKVPMRVNIYMTTGTKVLDDVIENTKANYEEKEQSVYELECIDENVRVLVSFKLNNTTYLVNHMFFEPKMDIAVFILLDKRLFVFHNSSISYSNNIKIEPVSSLKLRNLFKQGVGSKLTRVGLLNTDISKTSIQTKQISANSIGNTVPFLDDNAQVCTVAEGYSSEDNYFLYDKDLIRRYVGFNSARVTEKTSKQLILKEYIKWVEYINSQIDEEHQQVRAVNRYAMEKEVPEKIEPQNILIDFSDYYDKYIFMETDEELLVDNSCCDVIDNKFNIILNNQTVEVELQYSDGKFILESKVVSKMFRATDDSYDSNLIKQLNNDQMFKILIDDGESIYVNGNFYLPSVKIGEKFSEQDFMLGNCFITDEQFEKCISEKGYANFYGNDVKDTWDPNSLFGIISSPGVNTKLKLQFGNPDIFVCDDVGVEMADFFYCDSQIQKVVLLHAKADATITQSGKRIATSKLHDICSQALKNLGYLANYNYEIPSKINSWDSQWEGKISGIKKTGKVKSRIIFNRNNLGNDEIWNSFRTVVNNPIADKEVWLVLGNILSKGKFIEELGKKRVKPNVLQAYYLLHSTMTQTAAVGAKLRIICGE
jgi:superfamily II DNA or RNA helicase